MALYVNTNISSLQAQRRLNNAVHNLDTSYQRLSSGLRINSAKDDSAGLQISNRLTSQINGLDQGNRNANDAIALCQTIEGALEESGNMLQRIRTLAVQAANGTNTQADRDAIQDEVEQLSLEIHRITTKTTFGGAQILDGAAGTTATTPSLVVGGKIDIQVGANANDLFAITMSIAFKFSEIAEDKNVDVAITDHSTGTTNPVTNGLRKDANKNIVFSVTSAEAAQGTLANIDKIIAFFDSKRAEYGALQNRMESSIRNQANISENESDARSRIRDTDFASETAAMTQGNIIQQASQSILAQANQRPGLALQLLGG